jgi:hypothetical protein
MMAPNILGVERVLPMVVEMCHSKSHRGSSVPELSPLCVSLLIFIVLLPLFLLTLLLHKLLFVHPLHVLVIPLPLMHSIPSTDFMYRQRARHFFNELLEPPISHCIALCSTKEAFQCT